MNKITEEQTKQALINIQLKNLAQLLNGKVSHFTLSYYTGKMSKEIRITYDD